ncbi:DNA polymerase-3 subunit gamma/tau [Azonexus fungiphilus]|uniref:DNA polymerase III subunit gamma/tau n=1 Tax=Azonexus fungiphilus TaxID=146940 RepID=A0A495VL39_9RHOO|nr:DNA polymerase III subunit gamma/tau [Azonexus fungiphilus]RKT50076.1 DNA polymerase-3 subunit gamma/tau [Azonexus fungiphilus]
MSYQVLARKWRPRNFSTLVGQEHVVRALTHALSEQRLHHAYLFTGTRGVGKTTIARILAKSLNCETGITATPCGNCSACQEIDAGRFVDLLEVDAATNTRVDEMRQLLENAVYAPTRGRFKVYVIDEVHMLSTSAFNAMLKTLEEPPEHVKFILATTDPQKIPVTVLSRCLQFNLKQMPPVSISGHLAHILQAEGIPFEAAALALIARSAGGSMRDSLSLLDQAIAHGAGKVDETQVRAMLGNVDQDHLFSILEALRDADAPALLHVATTLAVRSLSFSVALQELAGLLTRIQVAQCVPNAVDDEDPERERLLSLAAAFSPEFVQLAYQIVNLGRAELALAPDEHAGFLMTLMRLHAFRPRTVGDVLESARPLSRPAAPVAVRAPAALAPVPSAVIPPPTVAAPVERPALDATLSDWHQIVAALPLSGLARELAINCELRDLGEGHCLLRLPTRVGHLQMKPSPEKLQQALSEHFRRQLVLKIEVGDPSTETPAAAAGRQRQERQSLAVDAIESDLFVREAIDTLGASIVESSIKPID